MKSIQCGKVCISFGEKMFFFSSFQQRQKYVKDEENDEKKKCAAYIPLSVGPGLGA